MRISTLRTGAADGRLVVISDDLATCHMCRADTVQSALDGAGFDITGNPLLFDVNNARAVLPRAFQFLDASAYVNHVDLVRRARGAEMPDRFWSDPLMYQGCSQFLDPTAAITGEKAWGIDFEAEVAVITGFVPQGASREQALEKISFVTLLNDISLRNLIPEELSKGFGFVQSKPASAMAPVAVSPSELTGWVDGVLHGKMHVDLNGKPFGRADAGVDMTFDFGTLVAHAAKTRDLVAGTVIGSGTISNRSADGGPGAPIKDGGLGYSCIAEQRMVETLTQGAPSTRYLQNGDVVEIWMSDAKGASIFGSIRQEVRTAS